MRRLVLLGAVSLAALSAGGVWAQPTSAPTPSDPPTGAPSSSALPATDSPPGTSPSAATTAVEELVVTGSRTAPRSRLETMAPVDVIDSATLQKQGSTELATQLSVLAPSVDFPRPAITDGTDSVRPATLRGLAPDQTLVLVNSRRRHSSALVNVNGSIGRGSSAVDLNSIPSVAIDRIEVLRSGASSQYGSDAIAGVINLRLRQARTGGGATFTYGNYDTDVRTARNLSGRHADDGNTYNVSGWQGLPLGAEGFLTVSAEYQYRNPTNRGDLDPRVTPSIVTSRYGDPQVDQKTGYLNAGLPLGAGWEAYGWAGYQNRMTDSAANPRLSTNVNTVLSIFPNGFLPLITTDIDDFSTGAGVKGELYGFGVNTGVTYGRNKVHYGVINTDNGSFGAASPTVFDAGIMDYDQFVANLDFTREFATGMLAKPLGLAFGGEFRREGYSITRGDVPSYSFGGAGRPGSGAGSQGFPGFQPSNEVDVSRHNISLYADLTAQLTEALEVNVAGRFEDYSDFGSTATGKIAARYEFTPSFAIRGTIEKGFRAPSLQQQYFTATSTNFIAINGISTPVEVGTFPATSAVAAALGGVPLKPEDSLNYSLGAVFKRGAFELTVDAYRIDIDDRIVLSENITGSPPGTAGASATALAIYRLINTTPGSALGAARFFINGVSTTTEGIDVVARYRWSPANIGRFDITGAANFNTTEVTKIPTTTQLSALPVPPILFDRGNRLTFEEGTPHHKFVGSVDWKLGPVGATATVTHYSSVLIPGATLANANLDYTSGAKTLFNIEGRYAFPMGVTAALGIDNVFDVYPNPTPTRVNTNGPIGFPSYSPFGFNGRYLYARLGYSW